MAYTKTVWVDNQSPDINATNLNHIEQGIYDAHTQVDTKITMPSGGSNGQLLAKSVGGASWITAITFTDTNNDGNVKIVLGGTS